jgi:hypothetical protein
MKQKNAIIGVLVFTLLFSLAMGAVGLNAVSNVSGRIAGNGTNSSTTVQVILATPASVQNSSSIQPAAPATSSGG